MSTIAPTRSGSRATLAAGLLAASAISFASLIPFGSVDAVPASIDMTGLQLDFSTGAGSVYNVAVGDSYRFTNVVTVAGTTIDAVVEVVETVNSFGEDDNYDQVPMEVYQLDLDDGDDTDPFLATFLNEEYFPDTDEWSYDETRVSYRISFIDQVTDDPVVLDNLALNVYDIDELQFFEASGVREYAVALTTILAVIPNGTSVRFEEFADVSTGRDAPERSAYTLGRAEVVFLPTSSVELTFGDRDGGGLYEFDFSSGVSWENNGVDVKADAVDPSEPPVPCSEVGTIDPGETITCALASGETLSYSAAGGHGGDGGSGAAGQDGRPGEKADCTIIPGGAGGVGGAGGSGGRGAAIRGTYTNTTDDLVVLILVSGRDGAAGDDGEPIAEPTLQPSSVCDPVNGADGQDSDYEQDGWDGDSGTSSGVWVVIEGESTVIAVAEGGEYGRGGLGGRPGTGGRSDGTSGIAGAPGDPGDDGADGGTDPDPLPSGVTRIAHPGTPQMLVSVEAAPTPSTPSVPETSESVPSSSSSTSSVPDTSSTTTPTSTPAPVPVGGELPRLVPGDSQVIENGVPVVVERFVDAETDLVLRGQDFELRLAGQCSGGCTIDTGESGREVLTLERDGRANVGGEGFLPGTPVYVWLFSEPTFLGELTVGADGTFTGSVSLEGIEVGEHTLQVNGISFDGVPRSANLGVIVNPAAPPTPGPAQLPATGRNTWPVAVVALVLVISGTVLVTRRTHRLTESA